MAKIGINLRIIPPFDELAEDIQGAIIDGTVNGVNAGVDLLAALQVGTYTASAGPPQPAGSNYKRTFTLKRSSKKIKARVSNLKVKGTWLSQGSIAPYNVFVIGKRQARIHKGRWLTDAELATALLDDIQDEIENRIEIQMRGL